MAVHSGAGTAALPSTALKALEAAIEGAGTKVEGYRNYSNCYSTLLIFDFKVEEHLLEMCRKHGLLPRRAVRRDGLEAEAGVSQEIAARVLPVTRSLL